METVLRQREKTLHGIDLDGCRAGKTTTRIVALESPSDAIAEYLRRTKP